MIVPRLKMREEIARLIALLRRQSDAGFNS
jgi:hypothetical protein